MICTGLCIGNVKCANRRCTRSLTRHFFWSQGHDVVPLAQSKASLPGVHGQRALYELCANACPATGSMHPNAVSSNPPEGPIR